MFYLECSTVVFFSSACVNIVRNYIVLHCRNREGTLKWVESYRKDRTYPACIMRRYTESEKWLIRKRSTDFSLSHNDVLHAVCGREERRCNSCCGAFNRRWNKGVLVVRITRPKYTGHTVRISQRTLCSIRHNHLSGQ